MSRTKAVPFQLTVTPSTLTGVTATASTDRLSKTAHGLVTGDVVIPSGFTGGAGITAGSRYYVIKVDADTLKLATTLANALAGTAVDVTSDGTGGILAYATQVSTTKVLANSLMLLPKVEGNTYSAYVGHRNASGRPDPRTPLAVAAAAFERPSSEYDLTALWVLCASGDGVDVFGFSSQPLTL